MEEEHMSSHRRKSKREKKLGERARETRDLEKE
jgi:hypothetical protein